MTHRQIAIVRFLFLLQILSLSIVANAQTLPSGFVSTLVAGGFANPTAMAVAPDGRFFVCDQPGALRVIENGTLLGTPFLTVTVDFNGERGLLGVAFDPLFTSNQYVYIYYTVPGSPPHNRVSRFTASQNVAVPGSEVILMELENLGSTTHNGGGLNFGPDGKLYILVGENGNSANAQTLTNRLGKVLRINSDGTIPADNPFFQTAMGANRAIWALGLRNPFSFAFQPGTGRMFINDVGAASFEEINLGVAGANYGWPTCEGPCSPANPSFRDPVYYYGHGFGQNVGCAIASGVFYNPPVSTIPPQYIGKYFFVDFCEWWINYIDPSAPAAPSAAPVFGFGVASYPISILVGPDNNLYMLARGNSAGDGQLWRIQYTGGLAPSIGSHPADQVVSVGGSATFSVTANGATPLAYRWQRNGVDIPGATASTYVLASAALTDNGARFRCVVTNSLGTATSNEAVLTVSGNQPPTATIMLPMGGTLYSAGETISYQGTGTDPEDNLLLPAAFTWEVVFHHATHTHPFILPTSGATSGMFTIPTVGETATNVWYRIHLTVVDSQGRTDTTFRDILPRTSTISLATAPPGLQLTLDGQPVVTPTSQASVVGMTRTLGVISPQVVGPTSYAFLSWSDGGTATHNISTPASNTTYTATFTPVVSCQTITVNPVAIPVGKPGMAYNKTFTQTGGVGSVSFSLVGGLPAGMSFANGTLSGVPTVIGNFPITVTATDQGGCVGSRSYTLGISSLASAVGFFDVADCNVLAGWAWDPSVPNSTVSVDVFANNVLIATVPADQFRQDLVVAGKGNGVHGFTFTVPSSVKDGLTQSIRIQVSGSTNALANSPRSIICGTTPPDGTPVNGGLQSTGFLDAANCTTISGWAWDPALPNSPIFIDIIANNVLVATIPADVLRPDLLSAGKGNGIHGFAFTVPASLKNGLTQSIRVQVTGSSIPLVNSPRSIICGGGSGGPVNGGPQSTGFLDTANCTTISGWAWDPARPDSPIFVDIIANNVLVMTIPADQLRQDLVVAGKGNGVHGFTFTVPASLKNGLAQSIRVQVSGSSIGLVNSPRSIICGGAPGGPINGGPQSTGFLDAANCSVIAGWAWDPAQPDSPVNLDVFANNVLVATFPANVFRQDLLGAGKGNGIHGFSFTVPASLKNGQTQVIRVQVTGSSIALTYSPRSINCASP